MSELNFEILERPVWYERTDGLLVEDDRHKLLIRNDDSSVLSIMKNSYNPLLIKDFKEITNKVQKVSGFELEQYQEFDGGRVVLSYLKNNQELKTVAGFPMNNYMVML